MIYTSTIYFISEGALRRISFYLFFAGGLQRHDSLENVLVEGQDSENKVTSAAPVADKPVKERWAIMVDVTEPVKDFHKHVPEMAHKVRH